MTPFRPWREPPGEEAVDLEIAHHLEQRVGELRAKGLPDPEARRIAQDTFGEVARYRHELLREARRRERAMRLFGWLSDLRDDVRRTPRALVRAPAFTLGVLLTLALGIGAATAVFASVDAVLLRPLPFAEPRQLVHVSQRLQGGIGVFSLNRETASGFATAARDIGHWAVHTRADRVLSDGFQPRSLRIHAASADLFDVLGRQPALGRRFLPDDTVPGARPVVVLSHPLWQQLGADPELIGRTLRLDGLDYLVIGVTAPDVRFPTRFAAEAFIPLPDDGRLPDSREIARVSLIGRLPDMADLEAASDRATARFNAVLASAGQPASELNLFALAGDRANADVKQTLWMITAAVGLLVLIGLANAIHLLITRTSSRAREIAVRHSLGASRGRLLRQLLAEGLVLSAAAGLLAVLVSRAAVPVLMNSAPDALSMWAAHEVRVDLRVMLFAATLTTSLGLAFALLPGWAAVRATRQSVIGTIGVYADAVTARRRLRSALLVGEVTLTFVLVAGTVVLTRSFVRLTDVDPGFDPAHLAIVSLDLSQTTYATVDARRAFWREVESRLEALPGVLDVAAGSLPPEADVRVGASVQADSDDAPREDSPLLLPHSSAGTDYLPTLGTPLAAGRNFLPDEGPESHVAIIDRDMARFLFGDASPVGRRFRLGRSGTWREVVGVIDDLMLGGPDDARGSFVMLEPVGAGGLASRFGELAVRVSGDAEAILPRIRQTIAAIDPGQPIYSLQTAESALAEVVADRRFFLVVMSSVATLSVVLAGTGVYSVLAFTVARRRRELGIRIALGASAWNVASAVLRSGVGLTAVGVVLGSVAALQAGTLVESLLFQTSATDPASYGLVAAILLGVATVASLGPARRAAQADPVETLRAE